MLTGEDGKIEQPIGGSSEHEFLAGERALDEVRSDVVSFIRRRVAEAGANGAVVAMSGGVDSTLTAALAAEAVGSDRVLGLGLPCNKLDSHHMADARTVAEGLGIEFREIQLQPLLDAFEDAVAGIDSRERATENAIARLRMACAYYAANARSRLVVGTANRSERLLGYFTKYGDGAADLYPIGDLYKTEVRALAHHVGVPRRIVRKAPTAGLRVGQTDEKDLGATYPVIDRLLRGMIDRREDVETAADGAGADQATAERIADRYRDTVHKRAVPPTPGLSDRGTGRPAHLLHLEEREASGDGDRE
ncbi:NAD+ synthase [Natronoarchaeum mannanilyticum]|uniref:NH(3)-dependent NAD(+) synthetase n=1 Tax=Natronoarchaeum mannanilyticum TaxID=926360 RepID=A0AAV3T738_9EURY